ncbi:SpoIID/LytB domain-containing protein [Cellulomonas rhizosphaerae]|uniref:Sporulation stage II protein D amidase enhancer LytB N-terminal domain-containing protein n=1 Tax=Cellulomonas rhizosphaerae TaxID=2293719 RepID=A0A413RJT5_9CELL|nr:SpoIID/LytB domain-containing protein [Cellulomonas rhizosphaerae]RHA38886.1 hypothetical protein D1825_12770 [Cellulomonas rhizosphaerae]
MPSRSRLHLSRVASVVAAALVLTGLATAPASGASSAVTARLTGPATINPLQTTTLTATYTKNGTPVAHATLKLQKHSPTGWRTVRTFPVRAGSGTYTLAPNGNTSYRVANHDGSEVSSILRVAVASTYVHAAVAGKSSVAAGAATTLSAWYVKGGAPVPTAVLTLQRKAGSSWVSARTVTIVHGRGTTTVTPSVTANYRLVNHDGSRISPTATVRVVSGPSSFNVTGSGYGHGVGMSQYGAYAMALAGSTAAGVLEHYYTGADVATRTTKKTVAVQILGPEPYRFKGYADTATSATFTVSAGLWRVRTQDGSAAFEGTASQPVALKVVGTQVRATQGSRTLSAARIRLFWSGTDAWHSTATKAVASISGAQGAYRHGELTATVIGGKLNVVNELLLNTDYLYGIAEMPSSWGSGKGTHALAAQAIAARSYALTKTGTRKAGCDCHLVDDVRDQNFTGWKKESEGSGAQWGKLWVAAVDRTVTSAASAQVLTYKGAAIATHYYSASGGGTGNSEDVWSSTIPWERSVSDPWSLRAPGNPNKAWTATLSQSSARRIFGLNDVLSIKIAQKWPGGQLRTLVATAPDGTTRIVTGKADAMRAELGLKAAWVTSIS